MYMVVPEVMATLVDHPARVIIAEQHRRPLDYGSVFRSGNQLHFVPRTTTSHDFCYHAMCGVILALRHLTGKTDDR